MLYSDAKYDSFFCITCFRLSEQKQDRIQERGTVLALMQCKRRLGSPPPVEETTSRGAAGQSSGERVSAEGAARLTDPWGSSPAFRPTRPIRTCHT